MSDIHGCSRYCGLYHCSCYVLYYIIGQQGLGNHNDSDYVSNNSAIIIRQFVRSPKVFIGIVNHKESTQVITEKETLQVLENIISISWNKQLKSEKVKALSLVVCSREEEEKQITASNSKNKHNNIREFEE